MPKIEARRTWAAIIILLALALACRSATPEAALPAPPPLPEDALMSYWRAEGDPLSTSESVAFYADGSVRYHDHLSSGQGSQFVGPLGLDHFLDALGSAGFAQLEPLHQGRRPADPPACAAIALRAGDEVRTVQWDRAALPAELAEIAAELAQFLDVVRASAQ